MNTQQLAGVSQSHTVEFCSDFAWCDTNLRVHKEIVKPLQLLCKSAFQEGNKLALLSGYRSYQRQVQIWQLKNSGETKILDDHGEVIENFKSDVDKFNRIARWSAVPGLSRHHWGTDIDIFSAGAIEAGYKVDLVVKEFQNNGPCYNLNRWMENNLESFSFFRPYHQDTGGVAPEPWHISFQPLSSIFKDTLSNHELIKIWADNPWCGSDWASLHCQKLISKYYS